MYVCSCRAVTDDQIARVLDRGVRSAEGVTRACGAGGDCGNCLDEIEEMVSHRHAHSGQAGSSVWLGLGALTLAQASAA